MTSSNEIIPDQPLVDDAALLAFANFLHDDVTPRRRTLWFVMLDGERRPLPVIVPVDHVPDEPDPHMVNDLGSAWREILQGEPGASILLMLERPGSAAASFEDHAWRVALRAAAAEHDLAVAAFFLATVDGVVALSPD
ncbi:hypothetical protein C8K30_10288 [Promicromonospora sp. AC04]|uniref:hypothetical protein n=1 Tax=Promicromonospora sp. AC04 TaxID=2135723 RepID=UPI000D49BF99|nr:hypothetical protein [Promicromonospora sp. AC04]PUB29713.1 hypothetical protein C8K30_10288 [Promicromonospora sp. AC04]